MQDKIIKCQNCGQEFVFTVSEQGFYEQKNLSEPKLCMMCRGMYRQASKDNFRMTKK